MRKATLLLACGLSACNLAPDYRQPVAPISATYPHEGGLSSETAPSVSDLGWQEYFGDPRLRTLIEASLEHNRDLAQSMARIEQARAQFRIQAAQRLPAIDGSAGGARSRQRIGATGTGTAGSGEETSAAVKSTQYTADVGVSSFEIDLWGRVRNLAAAERLRYLATLEGARAFRLSLIAQVASTYFAIQAGEERIALAERALAGRREGVRIAQKRMEAGVTSTVDLDQATLLLTQAEAELADLRRTVQELRNLLDVLTGGPVAEPLPAALPLGDVRQVRQIRPGLPSSLLADRPDVLEAELRLQAANANIGAARAAFFPTLSLTGRYGFVSPELDRLFEADSSTWTFAGTFNLPIFDWGRRQAQLRLSKAQADELVAAYQRTVQGAFQEVADALAGRRYYTEQIDAQTRSVEAQRRLARSARLRYDNGVSIYLEVLDAERNLFAAEQQLLQLHATALQNAVSLYTALGGGTVGSVAAAPAAADPG